MQKLLLVYIGHLLKIVLILLITLIYSRSIGQIGIQTNSPDPSSALDIVATDKGLLIPRVTLTSNLSNASPVTSPATGLLVFNSGTNQPIGFYYWNGSAWTSTGGSGGSTDYWSLTGDAGTTAGTNFIGTTDSEDFALFTDDTERMRFTSDGQGLVGLTTAYAAEDFFTIEANSTQSYALNIYSPVVGAYISSGTYGLLTYVDNSSGFPFYSKNLASSSYGGVVVGSNRTAYTLSGHYMGLASHGDDGIFTLGQASDGIGIVAGGNNITSVSSIGTGAGGAFTGYHGAYAKGTNTSEGVGVIGIGNNGTSFHTLTEGSGGAFTGYHGLLGHATNSSSGTGVVGVGDDGSYFLYYNSSGRQGSGGSFTGDWCGAAGYATRNNNNSVGLYGYYDGSGSSRDGKGVIGISVANSGRGYGVWGQGNRYGLWAQGNSGASGTKSFEIDHPLDPENKTLKHFSIESNEVINMYRGNILLDENGTATVLLPDYFNEININYSYSLTPIGRQAPELYIEEEINEQGEFLVSGGHPNQKISWVVYAERDDLYMQKNRNQIADVAEKEDDLKGYYLMPELYNQPAEKGIFFTPPPKNYTSKEKMSVETKVTKSSVSLKDAHKN